MNILPQFLILISLTILVISCKKDNDTEKQKQIKEVDVDSVLIAKNIATNSWIRNVFNEYYLWKSEIKTNTDLTQSPDKYVNSLIVSNDEFTYTQENLDKYLDFENGAQMSFGYSCRYNLINNNTDSLLGQVTYVWKNSPADLAGLKRGDFFMSMDNQQIYVDNYYQLESEAERNSSVVLNLVKYTSQGFVSSKDIDISEGNFYCNPILLDSIYSINGKKVGYLVYRSFSSSSSVKNEYIRQIETIFAKFKSSNINYLILDLRSNRGGEINCATKIASLVVPSSAKNKSFLKIEYNNVVNCKSNTYNKYMPLQILFDDELNNIGNTLQNLYFITDRYSASASEMLIYGLKPYMPITVVGETTIGKNVGSFLFYDTTKVSKWVIHPIAFKVYNSLNENSYNGSFVPDVWCSDYSFNLEPFGNKNEPLFAEVMSLINGRPSRKNSKTSLFLNEYASSYSRVKCQAILKRY